MCLFLFCWSAIRPIQKAEVRSRHDVDMIQHFHAHQLSRGTQLSRNFLSSGWATGSSWDDCGSDDGPAKFCRASWMISRTMGRAD